MHLMFHLSTEMWLWNPLKKQEKEKYVNKHGIHPLYWRKLANSYVTIKKVSMLKIKASKLFER